jgi:hypothetical protein
MTKLKKTKKQQRKQNKNKNRKSCLPTSVSSDTFIKKIEEKN